MLGKAKGVSSASGSKPQRDGRNRGGHNRNRGNLQRYDGGHRGNTQRYDHGNDKGPAALTAQIKKSTTIKELLSTHRAHESHLNHIHLSACWTTLAQQERQSLERRWLQRNAEELEPLVQHTKRATMKGHI